MRRKLKIIRYIVIILWIIFYAPIKARWGTDGWLILSLAVHELCSHLPKSQVHAQILLRLLSAAAVLWYFHLTGLSLATVLVIAITFTIWDFYQVANRVNP